MQVNVAFDPASAADVEEAMKAVMSFMSGQKAADTKAPDEAAAAEKELKAQAAAKKKKAEAAAAAKKKAEAEAQAKAEAEAKAEAGTESTADAEVDDPLAGDDDGAPVTQEMVLKALKEYREIEGTDAVVALLKEHGASHIKQLKPESYAAVHKAAS